MFDLPMSRDRSKGTTFDRADCNTLARKAMAAETLAEAATIILQTAETLPVTIDKNGEPAMGWREYLLKLAKALAKGKASHSVFNTKGNTKLPFVAFSALPFYTCPGMGACETFCYSVRAWRYPGGYARQLQNTLLLKFRKDVIAAAFRKIPLTMKRKVKTPDGRTVKEQGPVTFRLYVDGDFDSVSTVGFWMGLLAERPQMDCYGYSKSWEELVAYDRLVDGNWPASYTLNLSSGGRAQTVTLEDMGKLPITRAQFVAVKINYQGKDANGRKIRGFKRYDDPAYHKAVREAALKAGYGKVFSCPGKCGQCNPHGHVCGGNPKFKGLTVAIGVH
jgi:hypothetical protein